MWHCALVNFDSQTPSELEVAWEDIFLSAIRTLTSLTHENEVASNQLLINTMWYDGKVKKGIVVLAEILRGTALHKEKLLEAEEGLNRRTLRKHLHFCYDLVIFCLNTMTNVTDHVNAPEALAEYKMSETLFIVWLTRWLVQHTGSFRDAIANGSFGHSNDSNEKGERALEKEEEEDLVTAGNGFILLACLMKPQRTSTQNVIARRKTILAEMPQEVDPIKFMINTLKAFCNFYHYSVGSLSIAIVTPVKLLIDILKDIDREY